MSLGNFAEPISHAKISFEHYPYPFGAKSHMISRIEALNYRSLHYVNQSLRPFQVLIGPNASGKTTFLDVVAFMADLVQGQDIREVVGKRSSNFYDLLWMGQGDWFELAIHANIPSHLTHSHKELRYEIRVGRHEETNELALLGENLFFMPELGEINPQRKLFPSPLPSPNQITSIGKRTPQGRKKIISKSLSSDDTFNSETTKWAYHFRIGPYRSALANLPTDETRFLVSLWLRDYLAQGVQLLMLNSEAMRVPSPPLSPRQFQPDGSNLPIVIQDLRDKDPNLFNEWLTHIQTALPDIVDIDTIERPEDRHRYLRVSYGGDVYIPSWLVSDGTLRMLALTILAYIPNSEGVYLIEEPENGIHPRAIETIFQSLSSAYDAQILLATHSPVILSMVELEQLLCFVRTDGQTVIAPGKDHPKLDHWQREVNLSTLFASGVLG